MPFIPSAALLQSGDSSAPGSQLDYVEYVGDRSITATSAATANDVVVGNAVAYDGVTKVYIEFFARFAAPGSTTAYLIVNLWDGNTDLGRIDQMQVNAIANGGPLYGAVQFTPSAGSHTYKVKAWMSAAATGNIYGNATDPGVPIFMRITTVTSTTIPSAIGINGWNDASASPWTYASASTFTVAGDQTAIYQKGTRLKFTQTTIKYGVVVGSSFGGGTTTVTIGVNTDYVLANAAISANYYSYQASPQGYPGSFAFDCAPSGFSGTPTQTNSHFSIVGNICSIICNVTGTSNATTLTLTAPVTATTVNLVPIYVTDNSVTPTTVGRAFSSAASAIITLNRLIDGTGWTASGTKAAVVSMPIEF